MKSYLRKIASSKLGMAVRNELNIKPQHRVNVPTRAGWSVSDAFLWRTDSGFSTTFVFTDILQKFFGIAGGEYVIEIYDKDGQLLHTKTAPFSDIEDTFTINRETVGGQETFGYFYIFHTTPHEHGDRLRCNISNRCYVGYTKDQKHCSYVHGNAKVAAHTLEGQAVTQDLLTTNIWNTLRYAIQSDFSDMDYAELIFVNPTSQRLDLTLSTGETMTLAPRGASKWSGTGSYIAFSSKCTFLRPLIFCYKGHTFDAHHS